MSARRPLSTLSLANLRIYSAGVADAAESHLASLPAAAAARAARLRTAIAALDSNHDAWSADDRERSEAVAARNASLAAGKKLYRKIRKIGLVAMLDGEGGENLRALLQRCPAPSDLTPATAILAFNDLAAGAEVHAAAFSSEGVDAAAVAALREQAAALQAAVEHLNAATRDRGTTSSQRKQARAALLTQLRAMEEYLRANLEAEQLVSLDSLRALYLPRYAQPAKGARV